MDYLRKIPKIKIILFFLVGSILIYGIMFLFIIPRIVFYAPDLSILDAMPLGYNQEYVGLFLEKIKETGRLFYLYGQLPLDMFFLFFYSVFFFLFLKRLLSYRKISSRVVQKIYFLPFFVSFVDFCENMGIFFILTTYPNISLAWIKFSSFCTILKSMSFVMMFLGSIIFLLFILFKKEHNLLI